MAVSTPEPQKVFRQAEYGLREGIYQVVYEIPELSSGAYLSTGYFMMIFPTTDGQTITALLERLEYEKYTRLDQVIT